MGFHLGQRNDQVGGQNGVREIEPVVTGEIPDGADVVAVEIDKDVVKARDFGAVAGQFGHSKGVSPVARAFADADRCGSERAEHFERGGNDGDIGVDAGMRVELDEIGLEENALALDVEAAFADAAQHAIGEIVRIRRRLDDGHMRGSAGEGRGELGLLAVGAAPGVAGESGERARGGDGQKFATVGARHIITNAQTEPPAWAATEAVCMNL